MRVIAGTAGSLRLKTPDGPGTRPTTDRIKETLFNILAPELPGCLFIDLFSGSGGIGIEALSRGARKAYFVDNSAKACKCIEDNLKFTRLAEKSVLMRQEVCAALSSIREKEAGIIFLDPPYDVGYEEKVLDRLRDMPYVLPGTLVVIESSLNTSYPYLGRLGFELVREKKYKTNKHVLIRRREKA